MDYRADHCNINSYEAIFNLTDTVGIIHTLCGLSMIDEVITELR